MTIERMTFPVIVYHQRFCRSELGQLAAFTLFAVFFFSVEKSAPADFLFMCCGLFTIKGLCHCSNFFPDVCG